MFVICINSKIRTILYEELCRKQFHESIANSCCGIQKLAKPELLPADGPHRLVHGESALQAVGQSVLGQPPPLLLGPEQELLQSGLLQVFLLLMET